MGVSGGVITSGVPVPLNEKVGFIESERAKQTHCCTPIEILLLYIIERERAKRTHCCTLIEILLYIFGERDAI